MGTPTANKGYTLPTLNGDFGVWGNELNSNITIQDSNLGGVAAVSVTGNSNVTASAGQAQNLIQSLTGTLTGNIEYILPAVGGLYVIFNGTTGAFSVTIACAGGGSSTVLPQGASMAIITDGTNALSATGAYAQDGAAVSFTSLNVSGNAVVGGNLTVDGSMVVPPVSGTGGGVVLEPGNSTLPGFLQIFDENSVSVGVVGYSDGGANLLLRTSGSYTGWSINGNLTVGQAATIDGALTVDGAFQGAGGLFNGALATIGPLSTQSSFTAVGSITTGTSFAPGVGFASKVGSGGGLTGNVFNIDWTGSGAVLWIDNANLGFINTTSDRRVKREINAVRGGFLDRVKSLQVVTYFIDTVGIFKEDKTRRLGFISQDVQAVTPSAVNGAPDAVNQDGTPQPQSLNPIPLIAENTGAIQELAAMVARLQDRIATLEGHP